MRQRFASFCAVFAVLVAMRLGAQPKDAALQYIDSYSSLAVEQMYRSGIPASITLAQGMLESSNGQSRLARESNNHFGIKCNTGWTGDKVYHDDDAKGECFRKYLQVGDSYRDHSDFLRYKPRYASLFELELQDYKAWAHGLKAAGYATDPQYAYKLIGIIEKYGLNRLDCPPDTSVADVPVPPATPLQLEAPERAVVSDKSGIFSVSLSREVLKMNGIPFIYAREGETYRTIADSYDLFPSELASFNDRRNPGHVLRSGERVYLQRKALRSHKGLEMHVCEGGETLRDLAQKYAVRLKSLLKYNGSLTDPDTALGENVIVRLAQ